MLLIKLLLIGLLLLWRHLADIDLLSSLWVNELGHLLLHHLLLLHLHLVLIHLFWSHFLHIWVHLVHHVWVHAFLLLLHLHLHLLLLMHLELFFIHIHLSFIWIHLHTIFHFPWSRFLHMLHRCHLILFLHLWSFLLLISRIGFHWGQLFSLFLLFHFSFSWCFRSKLLFFSVHFVLNSKVKYLINKIITYNHLNK